MIKSQASVVFITNFIPNENAQTEQKLIAITKGTTKGKWILKLNGASNINRIGLGIILTSFQRDVLQ